MRPSALALSCGIAAEAVREIAPVVHCIAPAAATSFVADVLHGGGARSVVAGTSTDALAAAMTADAVMVDLGTLVADWTDEVIPTMAQLRAATTPWVLDATPLGRAAIRLDRVRSLVGHHPAIIRSAVMGLDGVNLKDATGALALGESAERVIYGGREVAVLAGSAMLEQVPGVRAAVSALMAACTVVAGPLEAALAGAAWLALASERAEEHGRGPASFRVALVDALWTVRGDEIAAFLAKA